MRLRQAKKIVTKYRNTHNDRMARAFARTGAYLANTTSPWLALSWLDATASSPWKGRTPRKSWVRLVASNPETLHRACTGGYTASYVEPDVQAAAKHRGPIDGISWSETITNAKERQSWV